MRNGSFIATILACLVIVSVHGASMAGLAEETMVVEGKRFYLVKPGDNLGAIAARLLGRRERWKEIWKNNPQIQNPELIFPGDTILIGEALPETAAAPVEAPKEQAAAEQPPQEVPPPAAPPATIAPEELMEAPREQPEKVPIMRPESFSEAPEIPARLYETCGYISTELPGASILGNPDNKNAMSNFDTVFVDLGDRDGLVVGQEFRILRPVRQVYHPKSGASMGWLIRVVGKLKIQGVQESTATATITEAYDYVVNGDRIDSGGDETAIPADRSVSRKLTGPVLAAVKGTQALIIAGKEDKVQFSEGDIIYLDQGLASGITPGTRFAVVRQGVPEKKGGDYLAGEVQVLLARNLTSTGLVTNSLYPLKLEDRLFTW